MALIRLEGQTHCSVVVTAGSHLRVLLGSVGTAALWCLPLTAGGPEAQLTCALNGIAIGLVCSRLLFRRQGYALLLAVMLAKGISPVNMLLGDLQNAFGSADLLGPTAVLLAISAGVLTASVAVTHAIIVRRN